MKSETRKEGFCGSSWANVAPSKRLLGELNLHKSGPANRSSVCLPGTTNGRDSFPGTRNSCFLSRLLSARRIAPKVARSSRASALVCRQIPIRLSLFAGGHIRPALQSRARQKRRRDFRSAAYNVGAKITIIIMIIMMVAVMCFISLSLSISISWRQANKDSLHPR